MSTLKTINSSFFVAYQDQCKKLIKTMTIKSAVSADSINTDLKRKYGENAVDLLRPETWKYYLNISGEYHYSDQPMFVTSLDTLETIAFTKENLAVHLATKEAYQYGTRYYYSLLNQFPLQDQLIIGILYPVDIQKAISAPDYKILGYPQDLVEPQEQTLINDLNDFLVGYKNRWNVSAFSITDNLYNTMHHFLMPQHLLVKLLNLRSKRCKTPEAHSFHIREYLASHKYLHRYLPFLTLKQSLWLYRNIEYLMRNAGTTENFNILMTKILTERRIPLAEYSVRQLSEFDEAFYPVINARRKPLNDEFNVSEVSYIPIDNLYRKELPLATSNPQFYLSDDDKVTDKFQNSASSVMQTKDLESSMVDYSDAVPDPLTKVLMRQWVYMAHHDLYPVYVNFKDPKTGDTYSLKAIDALIYHQYVYLSMIGNNVTEIPDYVNWKARNNPKPTVSQLLSVVDTKFKDYPAIAQAIVTGQPNLVTCLSVKAFFDLSYKIYEEAYKHWILTSSTGDLEKRGMIEGMVLQLYHDEHIRFNTPTRDMAQWLILKNLPTYDYEQGQAEELLTNIYIAATGLEVDETKLLKNVQKNLINLMMELSSYSIQTIREINNTPIIPINWPMARPGNFRNSADVDTFTEVDVRLNDYYSDSKAYVTIEGTGGETTSMDVDSVNAEVHIPYESVVTSSSIVNVVLDTSFIAPYVNVSYPGMNQQASGKPYYIGKEYFTALSDDQKNKLKSLR